MDRCTAVEMRKSLVAVDMFKKAGIDFVPVPVLNDKNKLELVKLAHKNFNIIIKTTEAKT